MKQRKVQRTNAVPLHVMMSIEEREQIDRLAEERGVSLRDLVVSAIFDSQPSDLLQRILKLETRIRVLETKVQR